MTHESNWQLSYPLGGLLAKRDEYDVRLISYKIYKNTDAALNMPVISDISIVECHMRLSVCIIDRAIRNTHEKWYVKGGMGLK